MLPRRSSLTGRALTNFSSLCGDPAFGVRGVRLQVWTVTTFPGQPNPLVSTVPIWLSDPSAGRAVRGSPEDRSFDARDSRTAEPTAAPHALKQTTCSLRPASERLPLLPTPPRATRTHL